MARSKAEKFAYQFHSAERVEWMNWNPCVICGSTPCDNAHSTTGGTGNKAHYSKIVPLCRVHHDEYDGRLHKGGKKTFQKKYGVDLEILSAMYQDRWQKMQATTDHFLPEGE
jgi:hypothetical protein